MKDQHYIDQFVTIGGAQEILECPSTTTIERLVKDNRLVVLTVQNAKGKKRTRLFYKAQLKAIKQINDQKAKDKLSN